MNTEEIKRLLPHRDPFLFVDRMLSIEGDQGVGVKDITEDLPFFKGHFPGHPVMPGVLIVEALAQVGGIIWYKKQGIAGAITYLAGVDGVRFREPVRPGDQLLLEVKLVKQKSRLIIAEGVAKVGEKVVCEATLMFVVNP